MNSGPSVLAVATDAGGAANVAPVAAIISPALRRVYCSDTTERFFRDWGVADVLRWPEGLEAGAVLDSFSPDVVLCGTTRYTSPDRDVVRAAGAAGVPSVVVLDEWFRYAERFRDRVGGPISLPNRICVQDRLAREEAIAEGLPADSLVVTGNPALCALADRIEQFAVRPPAVPAFLTGLPKPWIVFVSETHAADCGSEPGSRGPFGPYLGFTETTVAADLAQAVSRIGSPCTVIEKLHPAASPSDAPTPVLASGQAWIRVSRMRLDGLLWHADLVVGMRSIALLEAAMTGHPVLAYQPGLSPDYGPATSERLGLVARATTGAELVRWLAAGWRTARHAAPVRPPFSEAGSAGRVRDALVALVARRIPA